MHYDSLALENDLIAETGKDIVIVDDVITRGATLFAAYSLFEENYIGRKVHVFALIRTISSEEISGLFDPCHGTINYYGNSDIFRKP